MEGDAWGGAGGGVVYVAFGGEEAEGGCSEGDKDESWESSETLIGSWKGVVMCGKFGGGSGVYCVYTNLKLI